MGKALKLSVMIAVCAAAFSGPAVQAKPGKVWDGQMGCRYSFRPMDGATVADIDGDRYYEVLAASTDGKCYVWRCDGRAYPGFPKQVHRTELFFQSTPAVGDIDGDGDFEVVIAARGYAGDGALYAWHHDGTSVAGFPVEYVSVATSAVALWDLDGDGADEIIAGDQAGCRMCVFTGAGLAYPGWPKVLYGPLEGETAVGDIDGDRKAEILRAGMAEGGGHVLYAWNDDGSAVPGFPFVFPPEMYIENGAPILADLDNDGGLEIAFGLYKTPTPTSIIDFFVLEGNGSVAPGWPVNAKSFRGAAAAADVDHDGYLEVVAAENGEGRLFVWNYDGSRVPGFPARPGNGGNAAIADVDDDGRLEIFYALKTGMMGFNHDGSPMEGYPFYLMAGYSWYCSPAVWDIDLDGELELIAVSSDGITAVVEVFQLRGRPGSAVWPMHNHDRRHTACYDTDLEIGIDLDYFCARAEGGVVLVRWATASEWNHAGFNLYRAAGGGTKAKLNTERITGRTPYRYVDRTVEPGEEYRYWLEAVDLNGKNETYGPVYCAAGGAGKASFLLAQNVPNPAREATTVNFSVPAACVAVINLYDLAGRKVASRAVSAKTGVNDLELDVSSLAPGVYAYRLEAGGETAAKKMVVVR